MARFFIDRPVFAWVIAIGIVLAGVLALRALPVEQYPQVAPPSLTISAVYPGADAVTIERGVTQIIEEQMNGVDDLLYMSASSLSNGTASLTLTFETGTDIDLAQTSVQNRLSAVEARLPESVRRQGVQVRQASSGFLMIVALTSETGATSELALGNYASTTVADELRRVAGVGDVQVFGSEYAMRVWLDPDRLAAYGLSPAAVLATIRTQNSDSAGGSIGALPSTDATRLNATIVTSGRFTTVDEFENIILRTNGDGGAIRLGDVARVELGAQSYATSASLDGDPMAGVAVQLTSGANALATAEGVKSRMDELEGSFPSDIVWSVPFDTTPFVQTSVDEVVRTLIEAMVLVSLVILLFLQNLRATLIPLLVVPIALAGACLGLLAFGFSINVLSLFAMVLAIGILVDDAIIVIENVERLMSEEHLSPVAATRKAMDEISGAIIGVTLVLVAVFLPMAFFPGSTGGIYRQFSVTLAISIAVSAFLALSLTPAMCATLLKPHEEGREADPGEAEQRAERRDAERKGAVRQGAGRRSGRNPFKRFSGAFNRGFARVTHGYSVIVGKLLRVSLAAFAVFAALCALTFYLFTSLPGGFLPTEDQGYAITAIAAPPGATEARTGEVVTAVEDFWAARPEVDDTIAIRGFSFFGQGQSAAMVFSSFAPWDEREGDGSDAESLVGAANGAFASNGDATVIVITPPPIAQLGNASGFSMKLEDRGGVGREALAAARGQLLGAAAGEPTLVGVRPEGQAAAPVLRMDIDRTRAATLGLSMDDVNAGLSVLFGSAYVNDFSRDGQVYQVLAQARPEDRATPEDILAVRLPNANGELVPYSAFASASWTAAPPQLDRYNGYPAYTIAGSAAPGVASGAALDTMAELASDLGEGIGFEWTGISYQEVQSAGQVGALLGLSAVVVFLVLAALYESWTVPLSVLLVVPLGVLGSVLFTMARGLSADVYFNVGLITIIGLAAKNAILIVEFAIDREKRGESLVEATVGAARERLRPILMTSLAFMAGMVPLLIASGAGAASRIAVGTGVFGGMLTATVLGIFFVPVLYLLVRRWLGGARHEENPAPDGDGRARRGGGDGTAVGTSRAPILTEVRRA